MRVALRSLVVGVLAVLAVPSAFQVVTGARVAAASAAVVVPDTVEFPSGTLRLRGLVYRPAAPGAHPAVLFLHGSGGAYADAVAAVGPLYAEHGYLLFVPFRRGQGLSAGRGEAILTTIDREGDAKGQDARLRLMTHLLETEQMDDVVAALRYLASRPDVDGRRVAVAGNSFGGILAMLSSARAPGIRAAIASAPGAQTWAHSPELRELLLRAARHARVPVFIFQAQNDYDLSPSRELSAAMDAAHLPHRVKTFPTFGADSSDGHTFGYFGGAIYGPDVFAFLAESFR